MLTHKLADMKQESDILVSSCELSLVLWGPRKAVDLSAAVGGEDRMGAYR